MPGPLYVRAAIALLAAVVVVVRWALRRHAAVARIDRVTTGVLVLLALLAVGNYFEFSTKKLTDRRAISGYDLVHYYLNAKYFDELGYIHLYEACVVADAERKNNFARWGFATMRDLDSSAFIPVARTRARAEETKKLFTPRRWKQFVRDFRYLQRTMPKKSQRDLILDHGYNGPPLLQAFAGTITNLVPVRYVKLLCHSETVLLLLLFAFVFRTYGLRTTALAVLWYFVCFSARWPGVGYAIFRIDWFIALTFGCLLLAEVDVEDGVPLGRKRTARIAGAGLLIAYSTMMKIFPAVWMFGLGMRFLWRLATEKRLDRVASVALASFLVGTVVLGAIAYHAVGKRNVQEFAEDIREHLQPMNLSSQRMGFGIALAYRGELHGFGTAQAHRSRYEEVGDLAPMRYAGALLALLLLGFTIRPPSTQNPAGRTSAAEATELGFIPFYLLMIASHYYWINRLTMVLHHARRDRDDWTHTVGLALLLLIETLMNGVDEYVHFRYASTAMTSVALGVYCAWVIGARLGRVLRSQPSAALTPAPSISE